MNASRAETVTLLLISLSLPACNASRAKPREQARTVTITNVQSKPVTVAQQYVGQIRAHHFIQVRTPEAGYLAAVPIKEGQAVKQGDLLFQVRPSLEKVQPAPAKNDRVVSIKAPFDGLVDRLPQQQGSYVQQGETLTTLADNSVVWVYFNVPEARYLDYHSAKLDQHRDDVKIELVLANGNKFDQPGKLGAIGADFNAQNGNIAFRADFPNPDGLLRHGQTGTVSIGRAQGDAIVIPQRATFEVLNKRYVYVVDQDDVTHQREIVVESEEIVGQKELDEQFVVKTGIDVGEKIVLDGMRRVNDGDKVQYEDDPSKKAVAKLKGPVE
ncbi:MAG TPA: efflux RND transporter periplasmic adaptor subunit [Pirellulales bacterium]|jgi:membrane fusion protein (multidrug efflux system)|nr:efflux RND transporter periplasmic adaptor subunit [Pirellulales bacterium]